MSKTKFTLSIDHTIYTWIKLNVPNPSSQVEDYFRFSMEQSMNPQDQEKAKLLQKIKSHDQLIEQEMKEKAFAMAQLKAIEAKETQEQEESLKDATKKVEAIKRSGIIGRLGL